MKDIIKEIKYKRLTNTPSKKILIPLLLNVKKHYNSDLPFNTYYCIDKKIIFTHKKRDNEIWISIEIWNKLITIYDDDDDINDFIILSIKQILNIKVSNVFVNLSFKISERNLFE